MTRTQTNRFPIGCRTDNTSLAIDTETIVLFCPVPSAKWRQYDSHARPDIMLFYNVMWQVFFLGLTVGVRWEDFGNYVIFSQNKIFSDLSDLRKPQHSTIIGA